MHEHTHADEMQRILVGLKWLGHEEAARPPRWHTMHADVLAQEVAHIDATHRVLRDELQRCRHREKARKYQQKKAAENLRRLCLTVYCVSRWNMAAAVDVLEQERRRLRQTQMPRACAEASVEHWFLDTSPTDLATWESPDAKDDVGQRKKRWAQQFFVEWQLKDWVLQENLERGVAPTSGRLLRQAHALEHGVPPARFDVGAISQRERLWARRWRCKWGAAWAAIHAREQCTVQDLRQKAWAGRIVPTTQRVRQRSLAKKPSWGHISGPHLETTMRDVTVYLSLVWQQRCGPQNRHIFRGTFSGYL